MSLKPSDHSQAFELADKITTILGIIELLRPFLKTMAAHPEHNPKDHDGKVLAFSQAAGMLLKEIDEYLEWERELEQNIESRPQ